MKLFIPSSYKTIKPKSKPWFNGICKKAIASKEEHLKKYKANVSESSLAGYKVARNNCKRIISEIYQNLPYCNRSFWTLAKSAKSNFCETSFSPLIDNNSSIISDSVGKANLFAKSFVANSILPPTAQPPPVFPSVDSSRVKILLKNLNVSKSTGPDGISAMVLKHIASPIS